MKFKNARTAVAAVAFAALAVCLIAGVATGTWCGFGANDIAVLCPVGALLSMVAAKTLIPQCGAEHRGGHRPRAAFGPPVLRLDLPRDPVAAE